jgi:hypothetical protein
VGKAILKNCPIIFIREINVAISSLWNLIIGKVFLTIDIYFCQRGEDRYSERRFFGVEFFKRLNLKFVGRDEMKNLFSVFEERWKAYVRICLPEKKYENDEKLAKFVWKLVIKNVKNEKFQQKMSRMKLRVCVCVFVSKGRGIFSVQYVSLFEKRRKIHNKKYIIN